MLVALADAAAAPPAPPILAAAPVAPSATAVSDWVPDNAAAAVAGVVAGDVATIVLVRPVVAWSESVITAVAMVVTALCPAAGVNTSPSSAAATAAATPVMVMVPPLVTLWSLAALGSLKVP